MNLPYLLPHFMSVHLLQFIHNWKKFYNQWSDAVYIWLVTTSLLKAAKHVGGLKRIHFRNVYRDCIKRYRDKAWKQSAHYTVTSCDENNNEMWSTSCLITQHKPYIVELSFMETQKSNDSNQWVPSITMEGPSQINVVHIPLYDVTCRNHGTECKSDITPYHLSHSLALLHILWIASKHTWPLSSQRMQSHLPTILAIKLILWNNIMLMPPVYH